MAHACCIKTRRPMFVKPVWARKYHTEYRAVFTDKRAGEHETMVFCMLTLQHMSRAALVQFLRVPLWPDAIFANPPEGL